MSRAAIRGICGGILTAVYLYILLIFTYFNYNWEPAAIVTVFVLPLGCMAAAIVFPEKERMSKFFVSALIYSIVLLGLFWLINHYGLLTYVFRILYGVITESPYESQTLAVLSVSAAAVLLGLAIGFVVSIIGSVRIKRLIDSLEVPKCNININK
ncbi:MAG: hypothetical protein MRZ66_07450 [Clostridiales bacterium]|nr:hypothetical protein [Clostridiales bacterium]